MILLDTNIVVAYLNGQGGIAGRRPSGTASTPPSIRQVLPIIFHGFPGRMFPEGALLVATHNADSTREEAQYFLRFIRQQGFKKSSS